MFLVPIMSSSEYPVILYFLLKRIYYQLNQRQLHNNKQAPARMVHLIIKQFIYSLSPPSRLDTQHQPSIMTLESYYEEPYCRAPSTTTLASKLSVWKLSCCRGAVLCCCCCSIQRLLLTK